MKSKRVGHGHVKWAVCSALLSATTLAAAGPRGLTLDGGAHLASISLETPIVGASYESLVLHPSLANVSGRQQVLLRLRGPSVAGSGGAITRGQVEAEQAALISRLVARAPSAEVIASVQLALNAIVMEVDGGDLTELARDAAITRIVGVSDYAHDLSETVPYIGAATAHSLGATGQGVRVAVIDSGIDYTHKNLGGPGTQAAYEAAWAPLPAAAPFIPVVPAGTGYLVINDPGTPADDGLYPSAKVIGGYDFVGESWPNTALQPDPDPIGAPDATTNGGHGTHVADIIGGVGGVAPGVKFYAVKVCSAPATSCSGIALLQGMDFALDPNGDGDTSDHVDLINMSLGSPYGQPFDDDLSAAVDNATLAGVLTIASAGNSADKQFITGSPGAATSALSVAQTAVPSAALQLMTLLSPVTGDRGAVFQPWSAPLTTTIEGPVFYPPVTGGKRIGCADAAGANPYAAGELAGRIVLVDRGTCSFSLKIANIAAAGGTLGIIGLITAEAPFAGAFGGGVQTIPGYMISQVDANVLRAGNAVVRFSTTGNVSLAGSLASTSSRGPRFDDNIVKPEIGAPGASISAMSGSFTGTAAFGGTSGAAPMVTGAAAILKAARPTLSNAEIKQLLVNTASQDVRQPSMAASVFPDQLAPITRIGGGEVRVDKALLSPSVVFDVTGDEASSAHGAISFGLVDVANPNVLKTRKLKIVNKSNRAHRYSVAPTQRYQDDVDNGGVSMSWSPQSVTVPPGGSANVTLWLTINGQKLRNNQMNAGSLGNAIGPLTANEYDGYVNFVAKDHKLSIPWHVLPRKSSLVVTNKQAQKGLVFDATTGQATAELTNYGIGDAQLQYFSLLGTSPDRPSGGRGEGLPNPDLRAVGVNSFLVAGATCGVTGNAIIWEFAFNTWERKASPVGTWLEADLDVNNDGVFDYAVINQDVSGLTTITDGRQVTALLRLSPTGTILSTTLRFFVENATNTNNSILRVCASDMGLSLATLGQPVTAEFFATSWYFGGTSDVMGPYSITPGGEEFTASVPAALGDALTYQQSGLLTVQKWDLFPGTSPAAGLMVVTNSDFGAANRGGSTPETEALILPRAP
jgi:minor extracellular serine protease Vpr